MRVISDRLGILLGSTNDYPDAHANIGCICGEENLESTSFDSIIIDRIISSLVAAGVMRTANPLDSAPTLRFVALEAALEVAQVLLDTEALGCYRGCMFALFILLGPSSCMLTELKTT